MDGHLRVRGERRRPEVGDGKAFAHAGRPFGRFVPKPERLQPKTIAIGTRRAARAGDGGRRSGPPHIRRKPRRPATPPPARSSSKRSCRSSPPRPRPHRTLHVQRLELLQEGVVGLLRALDGFDPARGLPWRPSTRRSRSTSR